MPGGNRKGPVGNGPRTGRAAGFCSGFNSPGFENPSPGQGQGRNIGSRNPRRMRRRIFSRNYSTTPVSMQDEYDSEKSRSDELQYLKNKEKYLVSELSSIQKRIEKIESENN